MEGFKKSLFGGYKKNSVENAFNEVNKKLAEAENDNLYLKRTYEGSATKISELERKLAELTAQNDKLQDENKQLKVEQAELDKKMVEQSENEQVFKNIEKIYKRAYGTGYEIVTESRDIAQRMFDKIDNSFNDSLYDSNKILNEYSIIQNDIANMVSSLSTEILSVQRNADAMFERAKKFIGVYGEMRKILDDAKIQKDSLFSQYATDTSEFVNNFMVPAEAKSKTTHASLPVIDNTSRVSENNISKPKVVVEELPIQPNNQEIAAEKPSITANEPEQNAPAPQITVEEKTEIKNENNSHVVIPFENSQKQIAEEQPVNTVAQEPAAETVAEAAPLPEKQSQPAVESAAASNDFTQFGRKSRVSSKDRSELLRKALLKYGSNQ